VRARTTRDASSRHAGLGAGRHREDRARQAVDVHVLFSRLGSYDVARLHDITGPGGELFEYWGRMASLLPMGHQPLFRWRMARHGPYGDGPTRVARRQAWQDANAGYIASVLEEVRERGPLRASQLSDPRRRDGEWWGRRSVGRQALEFLFTKGELAAWRTTGFERVYDLPERVIPAAILSQPTPPTDEAHRRLLALAAGSLGVATLGDLASYYLVKQQPAKARVAELLDAGELVEVTVEGWRDNAYMLPNARPRPPARQHATLLSPFDSLIWERSRTRRLFGFDYRIEVYTPPADRGMATSCCRFCSATGWWRDSTSRRTGRPRRYGWWQLSSSPEWIPRTSRLQRRPSSMRCAHGFSCGTSRSRAEATSRAGS